MKQSDLDVLGMRIKRINRYAIETASLIRILVELSDNEGSYYLKGMDIHVLRGFVIKYLNRLQVDILQLGSDFEFPPSGRHAR